MLLRVGIALAAVAAIVFGVTRLGATHACADAQAHPLTSVDELLAKCHGSLPLATGSVALVKAGRAADARRLADAAVRRQPDDYISWLAVAGVRAARGDQAGATRARERARELNPLAAALQRR